MADSNHELTIEERKHGADELRMIKAARRDPMAFGELYRLYVEQVFRYLYSRIGNVHEAEDATSQTFLAAFESFDGLRQDGRFASWLFTIARNKAMDFFRQRKDISPIEDSIDIPAEVDPLYAVILSEQAADLSKLIRALPEDDRELLRLRYLASMSFPEIAHLLHHNEEAVKKSIYRLVARLHSQLEISNE
jgi:RNA polymerase sigma-70 factor, ECF subfamily